MKIRLNIDTLCSVDAGGGDITRPVYSLTGGASDVVCNVYCRTGCLCCRMGTCGSVTCTKGC